MVSPLPTSHLLTLAKALRAKKRALLGPVADPQQYLFDYFGVDLSPGQTVVDTTTGEEVQVVGVTVTTQNAQDSGIVTYPGGTGEAS